MSGVQRLVRRVLDALAIVTATVTAAVRARVAVGTLVLATVGALAVATPVAAQPDEEAAERAALEIAAARDRANQAADDYFAAASEIEQLVLTQERLEIELVELADRVDELRQAVEQVAVDRFVSSGSAGIPVLTDLRDPTSQLQSLVLASVVADSGSTTLDEFGEAERAVRAKRDEVAANQAAVEARQRDLIELQEDAEAEVERLRAIEEQRLDDEAVRIALEAQQLEEARRLAEEERRIAEAARSAAEALVEEVEITDESTERTATNAAASGGSTGGRTGGGGVGNNPRDAGVGYLDGGVLCPIFGTSSYGDTWGAPRSGGRRHQGVDMIAPTGTPLQAVVGGSVTQRTNRLGGTVVYLQGDNGNRYYYAHLSAYEGAEGRVETGQIIGYVGETGNATGIPHLHFEIRPSGGVPVNPYPTVRASGC